MTHIPTRFPVSKLDQLHCMLHKVSDSQLHGVVVLDQPLDATRLVQAVRLTLDIEPVLGCRFVEQAWRPYWERRPDLHTVEVCSVLEGDDSGNAMHTFVTAPLSTFEGPQIRVALLPGCRTLCVKLEHVAADATGMRDYLYLLAETYTNLTLAPDNVTAPNLSGDRSMHQVFQRFHLLDKFQAVIHAGPAPTTPLRFPWCAPHNGRDAASNCLVMRRIEGEWFRALKAFCQAHDATINDLMIAAFSRAWFQVCGTAPGATLPVQIPIDLRRYLPTGTAAAICNLSLAEFPTLTYRPDEAIQETLAAVHAAMNTIKANRPALGAALFVETTFSLGYARVRSTFLGMMDKSELAGKFHPPILSHFGILEPAALHFGPARPVDAYVISPVQYPPGFMVGMSRFGDALTLTIRYGLDAADRPVVEEFMDRMLSELADL